MTEPSLTLIDTAGIQSYIFNSNRLQENIGASEIVYRVTTFWTFQALAEEGLRDNVLNRAKYDWVLADPQTVQTGGELDAEVIYAGGGKVLIAFKSDRSAQSFVERLARRVLREAPGLSLVAQHHPFDWSTQRLDQVHTSLLNDLARHKDAHLPSNPLLGLSVTAVCQSTGLPASRSNESQMMVEGKNRDLRLSGEDEVRFISPETAAKLGWRDLAQDRLKAVFKGSLDSRFIFPSDIDKLGRVFGEESYVAVVHADGNRMGAHIEELAEQVKWPISEDDLIKANRDYAQKLRDFSRKVDQSAQQALQKVLSELTRVIEIDPQTGGYLAAGSVPLEKNYLPFRPLVFGGDDVTFLCNAQFALPLAAIFLQAFEDATKENQLDDFHACAGIAMVKMHYPFARAYQLSDELIASAKRLVSFSNSDASAMDWHFATSGLSGSLSAIRQREYQGLNGALTMRPVYLRASPLDQSGRYWVDGLERVLLTFLFGADWSERHNKLQALRETLRAGKQAVAAYRRDFDLPPLPELVPGDPTSTETGWSGERCVYFDPLELLDHFAPLIVLEKSR